MKDFKTRVKDYMKLTKCTYRQAKIMISHQIECEEKTRKAMICPVCGNPSLRVETSDAECSNESWVECDECEFTDDYSEKYYPLGDWYDFSPILWYVSDMRKYGKRNVRKHLGMGWNKFIENEIKSLSSCT